MFVTFLSDFGLQDDFVGTCHGVIKRIAPEAQIIDITHGIPPQEILQGALVLANTIPYMPVGSHLAVVDPGVGGARRALALRDQDGRCFVGPDNGLLIPAAERAGIEAAHELANPDYALDSISRTFHGRDLFAPAAAHLAAGVAIGELGPPVDPDALVRLDLPQPSCAPTGSSRRSSTSTRSGTSRSTSRASTSTRRASCRARRSSSISAASASTRSRRGRSRTRGRATSCSTRTATGTCPSRSANGNAAEMLHARAGQPIRINVGRF